MNKFFLNSIYRILESGIDAGYKTGVSSIIKQTKNKFTAEGLAVSFARRKILDINYNGTDREAIKNFKINAFKVAGVGSYELEEELKKLGVQVLDNSIPDYDSFEIAVRQKMLQYGIGLGEQPPSGWIKQNLDMAIKSSISGARWLRASDPQLRDIYTSWKYHTQNDDRVRDEHQALEGLVFRMDDPSAAKIMPPNDWGCRCYEEYLTVTESRAETISFPSKSEQLLKENVPEEFRFNPGVSQDIWGRWLEQKLHDMPQTEYNNLKQMLSHEFKRS